MARTTWRWFALALLALLLAAPAARAQDDGGGDDDDDEFSTNWFGVRIGLWYRPEMKMTAQISGDPGGTLLRGSNLDIQRDLGVRENPESDYMFRQGVLEVEVFADTRWLSLSAWIVPPFRYEGQRVLSTTVNFGGVSFAAAANVTSRFEQWFAGADVMINIINNEVVRLSPLVGVRAIAIDWELASLGLRADTSDIASLLKVGDDQLLPFPVIGAEVRLGLRELIEGDLKLAFAYVDYYELRGGAIQLDAGATVYPIDNLGIRLGMRFIEFDFHATDKTDADDFFSYNLEYVGANLSVIVRF